MFGDSIVTLYRKLRRALTNKTAFQDQMPFDWEWEERQDNYSRWEKRYANNIYSKQIERGMREIILQDTLGRNDYTTARLESFWNPTREIVEAYTNVFRGVWGRDIWINNDDGETIPTDDPLYVGARRIWRWSSLDTLKQQLCEWAALYGTLGLRTEALNGDGDKTKARTRVHIEHPGRIIDFSEDAEGNVTEVLLRYAELVGPLGEKRTSQRVEELLTQKEFRKTVWRDTARETTTTIPNALGVCPFVILRHRNIGAEHGVPAFWGSETLMDLINWRITRQDTSIDRHQFPNWFVTSAGPKPTEFLFDGTKVMHVQTAEDQPAPTLEAIVANINQADSMAFWKELVEALKHRQPELILNDLRALAGQSGETIAQLVKPVSDRIERAKAMYEDALKRAMRIGLQWQIMFGMTNVGTGTGTQEAAEKALAEGKLDFTFNTRPALPESPWDVIKREEADTFRRGKDIEHAKTAEGIISQREQLRMMQYTDEEIETIEKEKATLDVVQTDADGFGEEAASGKGENGNGGDPGRGSTIPKSNRFQL